MSKRSPEDILRDIEESDLEDEADRVLAMTPAARRKELEAAGVDVDELHGKADAWLARMAGASADGGSRQEGVELAKHGAKGRRARLRVVFIAAPLAAAACVALWLLARPQNDDTVTSPRRIVEEADAAPSQAPVDSAVIDAGRD